MEYIENILDEYLISASINVTILSHITAVMFSNMPCYNTTTHLYDNSGIIIDIVFQTDAKVCF
jgi:hypothetical protein